MILNEQLDNWFTYHPATDETEPRYAAIREAEIVASGAIDAIRHGGATHDDVNAGCRAFVVAIDTNAPDSADKAAAVRCVRLAWNAANEAIVTINHELREVACREAESELRRARWQANSAIACGGQ